jgi:hypothetical protein
VSPTIDPSRAHYTTVYLEACKKTVRIFGPAKSHIPFSPPRVASNYRSGHNTPIARVRTCNDNILAHEVDGFHIQTFVYNDDVSVIGIVDCSLDIVEIRRPVVIDRDYSRLARQKSQQANECDNCVLHVFALRPPKAS